MKLALRTVAALALAGLMLAGGAVGFWVVLRIYVEVFT